MIRILRDSIIQNESLPCQQETLNDRIDVFGVLCVVRIAILIRVAVGFRMSRTQGSSTTLANKVDLVDAVSGPTAVTEERIALEEEEPLVFHLSREKTRHDQVAFLIRVGPIQWDCGKSSWQWK